MSSEASRQPFQTTIAPWLAVRDARKAVDYYKAAFDAVELYRLDGDDGTIAVAQLSVAAGASAVNAVGDAYGWRTGRLTDPFGHDWEVSRQLTSE